MHTHTLGFIATYPVKMSEYKKSKDCHKSIKTDSYNTTKMCESTITLYCKLAMQNFLNGSRFVWVFFKMPHLHFKSPSISHKPFNLSKNHHHSLSFLSQDLQFDTKHA